MRHVLCPNCKQSVPVPEDLTNAHCVRCGQAFALETRIAADEPIFIPSTRSSVEIADKPLGKPATLPNNWSNWEEFRANSPALQRELMQLVARPLPDMRDAPLLRLPENLPEELDDWGEPLGTIQVPGYSLIPAHMNRPVATWIFLLVAVALCLVGVVLCVLPFDDIRPAACMPIAMAFIVLLTGGVIWHAQRKSRAPTTLWIFEEGIFVHRFGQSKAATWEDVRSFEVSVNTGRPLYWLTFTHDITVAISAGISPEVMPIMEYIEIRLTAAQFLRRLEAIWEGHAQRFGIVTLDRYGFHGPGFLAPWHEVRRVVSDAQKVFVERSTRPDWVPLLYRDVSFPYLVMAISHVLIDEHARFPR